MFIQSVADVYGASRALLRIAERLAGDGHHVFVLLPKDGPLAVELRTAGVKVILDPGLAYVSRQKFKKWQHIIWFPFQVIGSCLRTGRLVRALRPDIIHSNTALIIPGGVVAKCLRIPHVWHVREIFSDFGHSWSVYQWFLYICSDCLLCNSHATSGQFDRWIQRKRVRVLHDGCPKDEFAVVSADRVNRFRARYGLNGLRAIGLVGRIRLGRKGQDVFLNAAALLLSKYSDLKFLCIGSPFPGNEEHLERLQRLAAKLGLEDFFVCTGDVDDIKAAYASLDISVQCSVLPESFGSVVVESMAMGKPVVATAIGGSLELIEDGVSGLLVPPNNPPALSTAVELLLEDTVLWSRLAQGGRARFLEKFEFEDFYTALLTLYADATAKKR
ncbi:MAG TPA: glycosyltransferase [Nitrospira sp.]|nr:glycosyltransferase [Nitrospira sp.]